MLNRQASTASTFEAEAGTPKVTRSSLRRSSGLSSDRPVSDDQTIAADEPRHHRSKRVKTERYETNNGSLTRGSDAADGPAVEATSPVGLAVMDNIAELAARAAESAMRSMNGMDDDDSLSIVRPPRIQADKRASGATGMTAAPDVDFSSAPSDPTELALWVAKQINRFGDGSRNSVESEGSGGKARVLGHPPALFNRRFDEDDDPAKVAERERVREENRERKKRWRVSNAERNKDNDLRCRITKRAKSIWGSQCPPERAQWVESEFNKRRAKRETKERVRSFDDDGFSFSPGFGNNLFPAPGVGPQGETNAAGLLLANALLGVGSSGTGPNPEAANALKAALEGGAVDPRPFTEALQAMAANPEIMSGINVILGGYSGFEELSGDEDGRGVMSSMEAATGGHRNENTHHDRRECAVDEEESEIVKKLNQATAMLNELNESNEARAAAGSNRFTAINRGHDYNAQEMVDDLPAADDDANDGGLDQDQIDALLTLANGGTLPSAPGPDENTEMADFAGGLGQAREDGSSPNGGGPQPDNDMSAIVQRIIQQVMVQRDERLSEEHPSRDQAMPDAGDGLHSMSNPVSAATHHAHNGNDDNNRNEHDSSDPFGVAKNPAMALSSLLHCAGMSINTVIPAAQSHATSQFYARLSNHSRCSVPSGGGINPAHASAFGSTARMNQKLLDRPNAYSRPLHTPNTVPRAIPNGGSPRPSNPDEERKARSFGFPPLPGTKMVFSRRGSILKP